MPPCPVQIAFVTDSRAIQPTLVAMWSALRHASAPLKVIVIGIDLAPPEWAMVERLAEHFPGTFLEAIPFDQGMLQGVRSASAYISSATFARLFLHRFASGRVLYLDGDLLVTGDLGAIAKLDLGDGMIAGVGDYVVQKWASRVASGKDHGGKGAARLQKIADITRPFPPETYINAGVLLLDTDRIRAEAGMTARLEDVQAAASFSLADQDHINHVFAGRIRHLGPEWNCSWRRLGRQRRFLARTGIAVDAATAADRPVILHYHGRHKPWQPIPLKHAFRFVPVVLEYRWARAQMRRDLSL